MAVRLEGFELEANKILAESIVFIDRVPEKEIQKIIVDTDFLLMFKHDSFPNSFPSKFFDYIRSKKPIIAYTIHGEVSKEIVRNNIGVVITEKTEEVELNRIFNNDWNEVVNFNENYNWEKFSIESLAGNIEKDAIVNILLDDFGSIKFENGKEQLAV